MKTAELFALSCELSACLSGAGLDTRQALRQFGLSFGTAYQLYDDCVDLFGSEAAAGKSLGTDLAKGKLTLPVLLLWERADAPGRRRLQDLVECWQSDSMKRMTRSARVRPFFCQGQRLRVLTPFFPFAPGPRNPISKPLSCMQYNSTLCRV